MLGYARLNLILTEGASLRNQKHHLMVENGKTTQHWPSADSFTVETFLCSWKLPQDERVIDLLKWRTNRPSRHQLEGILKSFDTIKSEEVAKTFPDLLDVLFDILGETSDWYIDKLVFDCLLRMFELVRDDTFDSLGAVIDQYIGERFSSPLVYRKLLVLSTEIVDSDFRRLMPCLPYVMRCIGRSRILHTRVDGDADRVQFQATLKGLLHQMFLASFRSKFFLWSLRAIGDIMPVNSNEMMDVYSAMELWYVMDDSDIWLYYYQISTFQ